MHALNQFLDLCDETVGQLRDGHGLSADHFSQLSALLEKLADLYQDQEYLPKELVGAMLDLSTALYSAADAYQEPVRTTLYHQFDHLTDQLRQLCI